MDHVRINAAARLHGLTYSRLIAGLHLAQIEIDRKVLADLAVFDQAAFAAIAEQANAALAKLPNLCHEYGIFIWQYKHSYATGADCDRSCV